MVSRNWKKHSDTFDSKIKKLVCSLGSEKCTSFYMKYEGYLRNKCQSDIVQFNGLNVHRMSINRNILEAIIIPTIIADIILRIL